ncbi:AAA family ATPase [Candidatus Peregrinibacteria bacterium]|nr:AAA family ATPase [Candidatus Peregrinibacteria bacterium]
MLVRKIENNWEQGFPGGMTVYIIGQPKTRKTSQASKWSNKGTEGVILLDTEGGAEFAEGANVVSVTSLNPPMRPLMLGGKQKINDDMSKAFEVIPPLERGYYHPTGPDKGKPMETYSLIEAYKWLNKEWDSLPYDTIVIDTIDIVNGWIEDIVLKELEIDTMGQGGWGADWGLARRKNLDTIGRFQKLVKKKSATLVIISHSKTSSVVDAKVQLTPDLPRGLGYALAGKAELIGLAFFEKAGIDPMMSFKAYDERVVGSRLRPLAQKTLPFDYEAIQKELLNYKEQQ